MSENNTKLGRQTLGYNRRMPEERYAAQLGSYRRSTPIWSAEPRDEAGNPTKECRLGLDGAPMACERCGNAMYRMHAVWRCPKCRFKTDCCGW